MKEPVYFLKLELKNVRCFGEEAALDLSDGNGNWKRWTVILGDNGMGKTTLLQCIAGLENDHSRIRNSTIRPGIYSGPNMANIVAQHEIDIRSKHEEDKLNAVVIGFLKANNIISGSPYVTFFEHSWDGIFITPKPSTFNFSSFYCFGYGANRIMNNNALSESKSENSETLFSEYAKLINAEEWLLQLDYAASKNSEIRNFAINKRDQVKQILIDLLPDIEEIRFTVPTKENLKSSVEFKSPFGYWVTIHQLSLGYKTMVAWMVDLAARMVERYPDNEDPLGEPAIVLIDEIDLHLHPKWQRKIFNYLSEKFPQTQFIVTAHSPLIVQSAPKDANIVVLRKEGSHVVIDNDVESVQNWRLDQIMSSDLFGIESSRGPEAEKWLEERQSLLQKDLLTRDENLRLDELNRKAHELPTADSKQDIEAMNILRKAADFVKRKAAPASHD